MKTSPEQYKAIEEWLELEGGAPSAEGLQDLISKYAEEAIASSRKIIGALGQECDRAWKERNYAITKIKAWESCVFAYAPPIVRSMVVEEWGPGEGDIIQVPQVTPQKITDLIDELIRLRQLTIGETVYALYSKRAGLIDAFADKAKADEIRNRFEEWDKTTTYFIKKHRLVTVGEQK